MLNPKRSMKNTINQLIRRLIAITPLVIGCLLSGCVNLTAPKAATDFKPINQTQRAQMLSQIKQWDIQGAFSITSPSQTQIANYSWQLNDQRHFTITLASSLNLYQAVIKRQGTRIELIKNNDQPVSANSVSALMRDNLGFALPISNLYYWIRGLAAPGKKQATYNDVGLLTRLQQDGWTIDFIDYTHVGRLDLPQMIKLSGHNLAVKLVIKRWQLPQTTPEITA